MYDGLRHGRVVATHPEEYAVDIVMLDDGARLPSVQVLSPMASTSSGLAGLVSPDRRGGNNQWDIPESGTRDVIAVVGFLRAIPIVIGFLHPQVSQMLFADKDRVVNRTPSDMYSTTDARGNTEWYHPSGTYIRMGETPEHEDLTGKDFDRQWKIGRNTGRKVHFHIDVANGGQSVASINIDPAGNVRVKHSGNFTRETGGNATEITKGTHTLQASRFVIQGPVSQSDGNVVSANDVIASGISLVTHTHGGVDTGNGNTRAPN